MEFCRGSKMERYFKVMKDMWLHHFTILPFDEHEYDMYGKLIDKIEKKQLNFTKEEKKNLLDIIDVLVMQCDEEMKMLDVLKKYLEATHA